MQNETSVRITSVLSDTNTIIKPNTGNSRLSLIPIEIIWEIIKKLDLVDLSNARLVSRRMRTLCDHPSHWRHIQLKPAVSNALEGRIDSLALWNLPDLKTILEPHRLLIQTIHIWGVKDNIIQYILINCLHLQDLTVSGWSTLSDLAFRAPFTQPNRQHLYHLRRLRLVGQRKSNFTSLDGATFGKLIAQCPNLEELSVISCQIHLQADTLLQSFNNRHVSNQVHNESMNTLDRNSRQMSLKSLTVSTKRTWSSEHVTSLFRLCSSLCFLGLVPDSNKILEYTSKKNAKAGENGIKTEETTSIPVLEITNANQQPILKRHVQFIDEQEMLEFNNIIIYRLSN
jgi:hypothetical protein